jgi:CheY-like chemotaxis protein
MDLPADTPVKEFIDTIDLASTRARELAAQLLTFARGGVPVMRVTSLVDAVNAAAHMSSRGSNCKVRVEIAPGAPRVEADEGQIGQVLHNLLLNAERAMEEGGEIVVAVDLHEQRDSFSPGSSRCLRIRVTDTGHGLPDEIRERVFDPYYSTWSHHSGLGLATAYSIIRQHRGTISVKSQVDRGSEFTILLPAVEATPAASPAAAPGAAREAGRAGKRILVMDDEDVIRTLAARGLSRFGYEVVLAKDGEEAISVFEEAKRLRTPFAAVVLDMVIPGGLGGEKTIERLREIDPEVRGLAMSGYSTSGVIGNPTAFGFKGGLPKPFTLEKFAAAVAAVIAS